METPDGCRIPRPCANGCGFFGSAATGDLCSKCYRDYLLNVQKKAVAAAAEKKEPAEQIPDAASVPLALPAVEVSTATRPNRCGKCNKKVGLAAGFKCRCGVTFCGAHRYPEEHDCAFDFKKSGRAAISEANPVVKSDKLDERII